LTGRRFEAPCIGVLGDAGQAIRRLVFFIIAGDRIGMPVAVEITGGNRPPTAVYHRGDSFCIVVRVSVGIPQAEMAGLPCFRLDIEPDPGISNRRCGILENHFSGLPPATP
jgi:hypothetical protein